MSTTKENATAIDPTALFERIVSILDQARSNVVRAVNTNMVLAYWLIGREIVQELQCGEERAEYGEQMIVATLVDAADTPVRKGFLRSQSSKTSGQFYQAYSTRVAIDPDIRLPNGY